MKATFKIFGASLAVASAALVAVPAQADILSDTGVAYYRNTSCGLLKVEEFFSPKFFTYSDVYNAKYQQVKDRTNDAKAANEVATAAAEKYLSCGFVKGDLASSTSGSTEALSSSFAGLSS